MRLARRKERHHEPARLTVAVGGGALAQDVMDPEATPRRRAPIVRLPVAPVFLPTNPPVVAEAKLQVKCFRSGGVEDERYRVELRVASTAPTALLLALAEAAAQIEELGRAGSPDEPVILSIAIWG